MLKTRSGLYDKTTNALKNRIFNSDEENHAKTLKRMALMNVKKGKNSLVAVRNNGVTMGDLITSYGNDGIKESEIPWGDINDEVLEFLRKPVEDQIYVVRKRIDISEKPKISIKLKPTDNKQTTEILKLELDLANVEIKKLKLEIALAKRRESSF
jgi:hypothetical protein